MIKNFWFVLAKKNSWLHPYGKLLGTPGVP